MKKLIFIITSAILTCNTIYAQWAFNGTNIYNSNSGNVGVGTSVPEWPLEVRRDQIGDTRVSVRNMLVGMNVKARFEVSTGTPLSYALSELHDFNGSPYYLFAVGSAVTGAYYEAPQFNFRNLSGTSFLKINSTGNIGIGTEAPGSFKLAVEGKIGAREIQVTNVNPWPDFVFNTTYKLPTLYDVENHIKKHGHLSGVPSAEEAKNGIELGKMNAILLQKIEELTLYLIELKKECDLLKAKIQSSSDKN